MKYLLLLTVFLSFKAHSQQLDSALIRKAGIEFVKYSTQFYTGIGLELAGGVAIALGSATTPTNQSVIYAGAGLSFVGFIIQIIAVEHIRKAGFYLQGNKVIIPFGGK